MNSFLVAAGACISGNQYWCALEASQCPVGSNFVPAKKLEIAFQGLPAQQCLYAAGSGVPMGQCTKPDDKGICTGNKSNCAGCFETTDKCFEQSNGACTLEATETRDGSDNFALFGFCANPAYPKEGICMWSRDECPSNALWITPASYSENTSNIDDFCTCEKTLTGACRYGDNFICAVSEDACDGNEYIGVKALVDMNIDCRLCDERGQSSNTLPATNQQQMMIQNTQLNSQQQYVTESLEDDISKGQLTTYSIAAGACVAYDKQLYWCALDSTECPVGSSFISARELAEKFPNTAAIQCLDRAGDIPMGRCTLPTDNGLCTGHKSNCGGCFETTGKCFQPNDNSCTLEPTTNNDGSQDLALFGLCLSAEDPSIKHCLWSREECPSDMVWVTPDSWLLNKPRVEEFCTCDNVITGACRYGDEFTCAVSKDACNDGIYISPKNLYDMNVDCRLCDTLDIPSNAMLISQQQQTKNLLITKPKNHESKSSSTSKGRTRSDAVVVTTLSITCVSLLIATIWGLKKRREKRSRATDAESIHIQPDGTPVLNIRKKKSSTVSKGSNFSTDEVSDVVYDVTAELS